MAMDIKICEHTQTKCSSLSKKLKWIVNWNIMFVIKLKKNVLSFTY